MRHISTGKKHGGREAPHQGRRKLSVTFSVRRPYICEMTNSDMELVWAYAETGSEEAFSEVVSRYVNLVHSVALRQVADPALAQDVTQAVFVVLARKAKSLGPKTILPGWLCRTARYASADALKQQRRRIAREQEAYMQSLTDEPAPEEWTQISPMLESAMGALADKEQDAIVLRFYQQKSFKEVGAALGTSEDAVKMRVNRGLEKLRKFFRKRGVSSTTAIIAALISGNSVQAAPVGLAGTVTATAVKGAAVGSSTITLVKGTMKLMAWSKMKMVAGITIATLAVGGAAAVAVSETMKKDSDPVAKQIVKQTLDTYAALTSYSSSGTVEAQASGWGTPLVTTFNIRLQRPNLYHVDWNGEAAGGIKGSLWSDGTGDYVTVEGPAQAAPKVYKVQSMELAFATGAGVSSQAASLVPTIFFDKNFGNVLHSGMTAGARLTKEADETVGGVECFAVTSELDMSRVPNVAGSSSASKSAGMLSAMRTTFWIGKQDHLIHQARTQVKRNNTAVKFSDAQITEMLKAVKQAVTPDAIKEFRTRLDSRMSKYAGETIVYTQTQENIRVNQNFSPADFK